MVKREEKEEAKKIIIELYFNILYKLAKCDTFKTKTKNENKTKVIFFFELWKIFNFVFLFLFAVNCIASLS